MWECRVGIDVYRLSCFWVPANPWNWPIILYLRVIVNINCDSYCRENRSTNQSGNVTWKSHVHESVVAPRSINLGVLHFGHWILLLPDFWFRSSTTTVTSVLVFASYFSSSFIARFKCLFGGLLKRPMYANCMRCILLFIKIEWVSYNTKYILNNSCSLRLQGLSDKSETNLSDEVGDVEHDNLWDWWLNGSPLYTRVCSAECYQHILLTIHFPRK